ncbi:MAG: NAD-dependent epimerase/dehydratase family protein [Dehalococcoidia bacterium]|nr:MAG: NAD-dependent epimerase/dehydratase family protein [Dehalococcoidia bacterium]
MEQNDFENIFAQNLKIGADDLKFSNKKFLVTGGAGFIGSALVNMLCKSNSDVVVLDSFSVGVHDNINPQCEVVTANIVDEVWMTKVRDIDYILHFGAPSSVVLFKKSPGKCLTETVVGTLNVFNYALNHGVKKIIFPSSASVYGNTPLPQSENTSTVPTNLYGVAKLTTEHVARLYSDAVPSVALRIFAGYGPGEAHKKEIASVITLFMKAITKNSRPIIFGDGSQSRDFVYIDDIVEVVLKAVESKFTGIVNVSSGEAKTFNDVVDVINGVLGTNVLPIYTEKPKHYFEHTLGDIKKEKELFDVSPLNLEAGLKRYLESVESS